MTVLQLIEAARNHKPTEADIERFVARVNEMGAEYERQAEARKVTTEMLNRVYTL